MVTLVQAPLDGVLYDGAAAQRAKNDAIATVEANAEQDWLLLALGIVYNLCRRQDTFTTDQVWSVLQYRQIPGPHEPRALGAIMVKASRRGWCRATREFVASKRRECHGRDIRLWQSAGPLLPFWDGMS